VHHHPDQLGCLDPSFEAPGHHVILHVVHAGAPLGELARVRRAVVLTAAQPRRDDLDPAAALEALVQGEVEGGQGAGAAVDAHDDHRTLVSHGVRVT
jgi:hypothetical protein